jgi:hypothetical protein
VKLLHHDANVLQRVRRPVEDINWLLSLHDR